MLYNLIIYIKGKILRNILKILLTLMIFINIINADEVEKPQKLDKFDDLYYMGIGERLSAWVPIGSKQKATVKITIDKNGQFNYEMKKMAESVEFNQGLIKFLEEQKQIRYPVNRDKFIKIFVEFKSEEDKK